MLCRRWRKPWLRPEVGISLDSDEPIYRTQNCLAKTNRALTVLNNLAQLRRDNGMTGRARDLFAFAYSWLIEGFDMPDLTDAMALPYDLA